MVISPAAPQGNRQLIEKYHSLGKMSGEDSQLYNGFSSKVNRNDSYKPIIDMAPINLSAGVVDIKVSYKKQ